MGAVNMWRDTVTYDELTINERQKTDQKFLEMLDKVRRGFPDDETLVTLSERIPIEDKFKILKQDGNAPVCLFPKVYMCKEFNETMLANLPTPTIKIIATNLIDGTSNMHVRNKKDDELEKKVEKKLKELNKDINNTGGLEAKLQLAVGARVMLRCNVSVEKGLVNGALGKVQANLIE